MISIFTVPKPFEDKIAVIQRNAIRSWMRFRPECEIILCGNEKGIAEVCQEYGLIHYPELQRSAYGSPLVSSAFRQVMAQSKNDIFCYLNCDIILLSDFLPAVKAVRFERFLIVSQRIDLDFDQEIDFSSPAWEADLLDQAKCHGVAHIREGIDLFVFSRGVVEPLPDFVVGRAGWDNWMIYHARQKRVPVIELCADVPMIHQNHDYRHVPRGTVRYLGPESDDNLTAVGQVARRFQLDDATHRIEGGRLSENADEAALQRRLYQFRFLHPTLAVFFAPLRMVLRRAYHLPGLIGKLSKRLLINLTR